MIRRHPTISRGFTLIETFVAITVLMIAVLGPLSLVAKFYADNTYAKNQIAAYFLAQDGLETAVNIIKNEKQQYTESHPYGCDSSDLNGDIPGTSYNWLGLLSNNPNCSDKARGCNVDSLSGVVVDTPAMYRIEDEGDVRGFYTARPSTYSAAARSPFSRTLYVSRLTSSGEGDRGPLRVARLTSKVSWNEKGVPAKPVELNVLVVENLCY